MEGKHIAEAIQLALEFEVHSTVWHQGVFGLSGGTLETLVSALNQYDFATLVLTADDLLEKRSITGRSPRDNVLFELGLFMGALGRFRTFIVHSRTNPPMLPTDLAGITPATYEDRDDLDAALGPVCTKIKRAIKSQGVRARAPDADTKNWVQIGSHPDGRIPIWFRDVTDFKLPDHKIHKCSNSFINSGSWI